MKINRDILESAYKLYPRKMGKAAGIKSALRMIRTNEKLELLKTAILNYRAYLERERTESNYVLYFSTFMSQWEDWLDPNHGAKEDFSQTGSHDLSEIFK